MSFQELQEVPGIGKVKAIELLAAIEFGKRIQTSQVIETEQIMSSQKLAKMMQQKIGHEKQEHLLALYLNTQNQIIHQQVILSEQSIVALQNLEKSCIMPSSIWRRL